MFHLERFYILQTAQTAQVWRHPHPWITDRLCRRGIHAADRGGTVSNLSCSWSQQFTRCLCAISCRHTFCGGCCRCFESAFVREHLWTLWFDFTSLRDPVHGYVLVSKVISLKLSVRFHFSLSYFAYCHEFCRSYFNLSGSFNLISPIHFKHQLWHLTVFSTIGSHCVWVSFMCWLKTCLLGGGGGGWGECSDVF